MGSKNQHGDWRDGFLFVGNQLALDFVNTRPMMDGALVELLPDIAALLRWFVAAGLIETTRVTKLQRDWHGQRAASRVLESMRDFRERLRNDVIALEGGGDPRRSTLAELDRLLAAHPMRKRLRMKNGQAQAESWFPLDRPEDLYAPLADAAAKLFTDEDRSRIRKCGTCILHFLDISKKGNRQWCSMQLCGNRAKVAAYAAARKKAEVG